MQDLNLTEQNCLPTPLGVDQRELSSFSLKEAAPLDRFFAERVLKKEGAYTEERAAFLSQLMRESRVGHLCWKPAIEVSLPPSILSTGEGLFPSTPIVRQENRYYLQKNWVYETHLLDQIKRLRASPVLEGYDEEVFRKELQKAVESGKLLPSQGKAIESAFENSFSILSGGPGTGKTYTASFFVRLLMASSSKKNRKVFLTAPTGKAASHLQTAFLAHGPSSLDFRIETGTLHRILQLKEGENPLFARQKIDADLVIVDEASMIDISLLVQLFSAVGKGTRLLLMGDPDQLPPVEAGSLFAELADLFATPLQQSMRTQQSHLQMAAAAINRGEESALKTLPFDDAFSSKLYAFANPLLFWEQPNPKDCFESLNRFRILGALRQGPLGIDRLNGQIIAEMERRKLPGQWWAIPIMVTVNDSRKGLYNGNCGVLIGKSSGKLNLREGIAYFSEGGEFRAVKGSFPFEVAFCLSIHKSQGSEFEHVLALFPKGSENFGREALYTAVTRAKKDVEIVAEENVLRKMLNQRSRRTSGFTERFKLL